MKTQKVEIEIPIFDGYEFVEYGIVKKKHELDNYYIYFPPLEGLLCLANSFHIGEFHFIYRKKPTRKIIFEETVVDYVEPGELFMDDFGMPNIWEGKGPSFMKASKLKKTLDDFEVNNG